MAVVDITGVSNLEMWDLARRVSPSFASHTAKGTADLFTEKGFEALQRSDVNAINEYFQISLRVGFQSLLVSRAKNPLEGSGLVEHYDTPNGGYVQRMAVSSIKPVTPAFKGLKNGDSVDPFIVRKPEANERFFQQNFDYQSFITMQDFNVKQIFVSEFGMSQFVAGIMAGLQNGYTVQEFENTLEALNKAINSEKYPLQDTQVVNLKAWDKDPTAEELEDFILTTKNLVSNMTSLPQTSAFNAGKFSTAIDTSDLVMLIRPDIKNEVAVKVIKGAYNADTLAIPIDQQEVNNFGGLIPYKEADYQTRLYPVYDKNGEQIGWNEAEGETQVTVQEGEEYYKDPNEDIVAVIAQKGLIFENTQNPYQVIPIQNPRGLYTNYWASSPNNAICVDPYYTMVVIRKPKRA